MLRRLGHLQEEEEDNALVITVVQVQVQAEHLQEEKGEEGQRTCVM